MKELSENIGKPIGIYDSANGESLDILKSVDITPIDSSEVCVLNYTRAERGPIVQVMFDDTMCAHFFINELHEHDEPVFDRFARDLNMTPNEFKTLVREHEPA